MVIKHQLIRLTLALSCSTISWATDNQENSKEPPLTQAYKVAQEELMELLPEYYHGGGGTLFAPSDVIRKHMALITEARITFCSLDTPPSSPTSKNWLESIPFFDTDTETTDTEEEPSN